MKRLALLLVIAAAVALRAQSAPTAQSVVAPCQFVSADLGLSGETSPELGRGFSLHVVNQNSHAIALPSVPQFGWMVEARRGSGWKRTAVGGPVRRLGSSMIDMHLAVVGPSGMAPMVELAPGESRDFHFFLPQSDAALRPDPRVELTTMRLSVFWAASPEIRKLAPDVPPCGITATWTVSLQRPADAQPPVPR